MLSTDLFEGHEISLSLTDLQRWLSLWEQGGSAA